MTQKHKITTETDFLWDLPPLAFLEEEVESEREKLNFFASGGGKVGDLYRQSCVVDRLIDQLLDQKKSADCGKKGCKNSRIEEKYKG